MTTPSTAELAALVQELRQATEQQRREALAHSPATPAGEALQAILEALGRLQAWLPYLTEQQRVTLAIGEVPALHTREIREMEGAIEAAWWRAGDRDEFDLRVQEMSTVLRGGAVALLGRVRAAVVQRLAKGGQAPLEVERWSSELLQQRSEEPVGDRPITDLAKAVLQAYGQLLRDGDGLVFGQVMPADAQLWMECSAEVGNRARREGSRPARDVMHRRVARLFNKVRHAGCSSVVQFKQRRSERFGPWGRATEYRRDSWGRMVNGLGQPVEMRNGRYEVEKVGFSGVFEEHQYGEVVDEIQRASRAALERS